MNIGRSCLFALFASALIPNVALAEVVQLICEGSYSSTAGKRYPSAQAIYADLSTNQVCMLDLFNHEDPADFFSESKIDANLSWVRNNCSNGMFFDSSCCSREGTDKVRLGSTPSSITISGSWNRQPTTLVVSRSSLNAAFRDGSGSYTGQCRIVPTTFRFPGNQF
jgi:hypothetical protein